VDNYFKQQVRNGKGVKTSYTTVNVKTLLDEDGHLNQTGGNVPTDDVYILIRDAIERMNPSLMHRQGNWIPAIPKKLVEQILVNIFLVDHIQVDIDEVKALTLKEDDTKNFKSCYAQAKAIAKDLMDARKAPTAEDVVNAIAESKDSKLTAKLLFCSNVDAPPTILDGKKFTSLDSSILPVTIASAHIHGIQVKVCYVREDDGYAMVRIYSTTDQKSLSVLPDRQKEVRLNFDKDQPERNDLVSAQLTKSELDIQVSAECWIDPKFDKRVNLTLISIGNHAAVVSAVRLMAEQMPIEF